MKVIHEISGAGAWTGAGMLIADDEAIPPSWTDAPLPEDAEDGDLVLWTGGAWIVPNDAQRAAYEQSATPRQDVPVSVTRRQAKLALLAAGLLEAAEAAIMAAGPAAMIDWQDADTFRRDNPLIEAMRLALNLSHEDVDNLFRAAALYS